MGVCKNRSNHPRHDVVHFRNAELSSFNGCGFCKVRLAAYLSLLISESRPSGPNVILGCRPQMLPGKIQVGQAAVVLQNLTNTNS